MSVTVRPPREQYSKAREVRATESVSNHHGDWHSVVIVYLVLVGKDIDLNWMPSVASSNPTLTFALVPSLWCDLGCCSQTVVVLVLKLRGTGPRL